MATHLLVWNTYCKWYQRFVYSPPLVFIDFYHVVLNVLVSFQSPLWTIYWYLMLPIQFSCCHFLLVGLIPIVNSIASGKSGFPQWPSSHYCSHSCIMYLCCSTSFPSLIMCLSYFAPSLFYSPAMLQFLGTLSKLLFTYTAPLVFYSFTSNHCWPIKQILVWPSPHNIGLLDFIHDATNRISILLLWGWSVASGIRCATYPCLVKVAILWG